MMEALKRRYPVQMMKELKEMLWEEMRHQHLKSGQIK